MIRAGLALLMMGTAAEADLPTPLFCITLELCQTAEVCEPRRNQPPFVLRRTGDEWVMHFGPRRSDAWVVLVPSAQMALDQAPEGARLVAIEAGVTPEGAYLLHEHLLEPAGLSARYARHQCDTADGATG